MKTVQLFIIIILNICHLNAQEIIVNNKPLNYYIANTNLFEENQTKPHAPISPNINTKIQNNLNWTDSEWTISLNGLWKFKWNINPESSSWNFYEEDYNLNDWSEINVPSCWQMEGFGDPKFRNVHQPFVPNPPHPPTEYNPVGSYKRNINIPEQWNNRRILLYFEGIKTSSFIWINGKYVGYNEGGMEPAEFDITKFLKTGINQIAIQVLRYSDATYLECQDMWRLSGIYRPVYLFAMPKTHIRDYFIKTDLDSDYMNAQLDIDLDLFNSSNSKISNYKIEGILFDNTNNVVGKITKNNISIYSNSNKSINLNKTIYNPLKWSAEKPNLYTMKINLIDNQNALIHSYQQQVGFRKVEVKDQAILVNGIPVKLNGVCSHVHHPKTGRTMDIETMKKDIILMKQFNINCIRTAHYPMNREFYEIANEYGMYIIDEVNDESHATTWLSEKPEWNEMYLDRVRKMVYRDRNNPSIIIWSAGNESGNGANICNLIEEGKRIDPSRPAWLYGGNEDFANGPGELSCEDIVGPRYLTPSELKMDFANSNDPRPSFMDEYMAVTGNSGGVLDEYWDVIRSSPRTIGGAIWDWVSPTITTPWVETKDDSKYMNNGSIFGNYKLVEGRFGKAFSPSGQDAWIEIYRAPELDLDKDSLTISFWIKPKKWNGLESFITKGNWQFGVHQTKSDSIEFYLTTSDRTKLVAEVPENWENKWHHVLCSYDGQIMRMLIDGNYASSIKKNGDIINTPFPINLCRNWETDDQDFTRNMSNADFDRVTIFDKVLNVSELTKANSNDAVLWLDFEETNSIDTFYSQGIGGRTYGLVWPDRSPQPELYQLKKSAQPISAEIIDLNKKEIRIKNWHHFTNLKDFQTKWEITSNGKILEEGNLILDINPQSESIVEVPFSNIYKDKHCQLLIKFLTKKNKIWAKEGHEVAFVQYELPYNKTETSNSFKTNNKLIIDKTDSTIKINANNIIYTFSKTDGTLSSIKIKNEELIEKGPKLNVWRAPLSNDLDSWNYKFARVVNPNPALGKFNANGYYDLNLNNLNHYCKNFEVIEYADSVKIIINSNTTNNNKTTFFNEYIYSIYESGEMCLTHKFSPYGEMPNFLPKIGIQIELNKNLNNWKWFGRGPFETYPDRKSGAKIGLWESTVEDEYVPYIMPQDYGNRTDVSWTSLDNEKVGILFESITPINISAQKWNTDNLTRSLYIPQLKNYNAITFNLDPQVSGVGGTAISVLDKYRVMPKNITYSIRILPFDLAKTNPLELSQRN